MAHWAALRPLFDFLLLLLLLLLFFHFSCFFNDRCILLLILCVSGFLRHHLGVVSRQVLDDLDLAHDQDQDVVLSIARLFLCLFLLLRDVVEQIFGLFLLVLKLLLQVGEANLKVLYAVVISVVVYLHAAVNAQLVDLLETAARFLPVQIR